MINTLIVDDSSLARDILRDFLESDGNFNIIGEAADGEEGIEKILSLNPDLVTLDIEMPKKSGLEVIEEVMKKSAVPIVVITSHDTAKTAYDATCKGALEFYAKDTFSASITPGKRQEILETLKRISSIKRLLPNAGAIKPVAKTESLDFSRISEKREIHAVVIASSTGGPRALSIFFSLLPDDFAIPIVIVQHNTSGFDLSFVQWLGTYTSLNVKIAEEGENLKSGTVYIAQTDKHLELKCTEQSSAIAAENIFLGYNNDEPVNNQKPAADVLFKTAAKSLKEAVISVVLTGMGNDGAMGTKAIREMGGITVAQDEESSLIYGMPKAAAETGCVDKILPLDIIPLELAKLTWSGG